MMGIINYCFVGGILSGISDLAQTSKYEKQADVPLTELKETETKAIQSQVVDTAKDKESEAQEKETSAPEERQEAKREERKAGENDTAPKSAIRNLV